MFSRLILALIAVKQQEQQEPALGGVWGEDARAGNAVALTETPFAYQARTRDIRFTYYVLLVCCLRIQIP